MKERLLEIVEVLITEPELSTRLQTYIPSWSIPDSPEAALEFKLLCAALDRNNYDLVIDPETNTVVPTLTYPDDLVLEINSWQSEEFRTHPLRRLSTCPR